MSVAAEDVVARASDTGRDGRVVSSWDLVRYFGRLGATGFGGPVVLVERMRRELHEERGWITDAEFREAMALAQMAPGPLAAQVAIYLGWLRGGAYGATLVGVAFIAPSFLMVMALSAAYVGYSGLPWMRGAFYGVGAAAIALIAHSAYKLVRKTARADALLWTIVGCNAVITALTQQEMVWVIVASGLTVLIVRTQQARVGSQATSSMFAIPPLLLTGIHGHASPDVLLPIMGYFARAGAVVFGSGLAIVPYLHGGVVGRLGWLTEQQFLDAVAVSMITPGPVVISVAFIGYLVAGPLGGIAAAIGVFLPVYLVVVLLARTFKRATERAWMRALVEGVTAGAAGALVGAAFVLGRRALIDAPTWLFFVLTLMIILRRRRVPEPALLLVAGAAGMALR